MVKRTSRRSVLIGATSIGLAWFFAAFLTGLAMDDADPWIPAMVGAIASGATYGLMGWLSRHKSDRAVFLDRDGTVIEDVPYATDPRSVSFVDGGIEWLGALQEHDFKLIVITNQSLVGRGYGGEDGVRAVNDRMVAMLADEDIVVTDIKCAYELPDSPPYRRKPSPDMILEAAREHGIDLARSAMIGDKPSDVEAGERAGCGLNLRIDPAASQSTDSVVRSFAEAAQRVIDWAGASGAKRRAPRIGR